MNSYPWDFRFTEVEIDRPLPKELQSVRHRWTVRRLMIWTAIAAVLCFVIRTCVNSLVYESRVREHTEHLLDARFSFYASQERTRWHEAMRAKYDQARRRPWASVAPDSVEPIP